MNSTSTTNYEMYKGMVNSINLNKIFGILADEIFESIPEEVMSEGMKGTVLKATKVIIPVVTGVYKNSFLSIYKEEFSDEEFGRLLAFYGPGSTLWSFFNTSEFFPWLREMIREVIQERIEGLDLTTMTTVELQNLTQIGLSEILDKLPEWVKVGSAEYFKSDLYSRENTLGDKIVAEDNKMTNEINWFDLLEKAGITLPNEED